MNEAGDRREAGRRWDAAESQPISMTERALVARIYALFDCFYDQLSEEHEQMRRARMLRARRPDEQSRTAPTGNTLGSCVDNMIADQMDNLPEAVMLPEREETARSAEEMDDVVSFVLYRAGWSGKYQTLMEDAIVTGTGVAQVFWDEDMEDGEGMVNVLAWHPEDFYPDPMYEDMQDGRGCFKATRTSVAWVEQHYPQAKGYVTGDEYAKEEADDRQTPEGDTRVTLLEFWYKQYDAATKRTHVHMAQVAGRALLFSTETGYGAERTYPEGLYAATVEQCRRMIQRDAQGLLAFETKPEWVGVGGTMTTLGAMERAIPLFDAQTCEGMTMDLPTVAGWGRRLARMSMAERRQVPGLMAHRADIIPSGVAILEAAMREFGLNELRLSAHGNMDGYLKKKFQEKA